MATLNLDDMFGMMYDMLHDGNNVDPYQLAMGYIEDLNTDRRTLGQGLIEINEDEEYLYTELAKLTIAAHKRIKGDVK